ncbi:MAG: hypothetical protein J1E65_07615 [Lachnospiraceae bacterium]|nr:hypothetical protein [Lachnospiraceae bacterium]
MNSKKMNENIRERDVWLYGAQDEVKAFLDKYKTELKICGVITEYMDEVRVQPYKEWNLQAELMNKNIFQEGQLIIVCHRNEFHVQRWRLLYLGFREYEDFISGSLIESLLYNKNLMLCMGTHLISQVCLLFQNCKEITGKYSIVYYAESDLMEPYRNQYAEYVHVARYCDIYIRSDCEKESFRLKVLNSKAFTENCKVITIADYGFAGYFLQIERNRDRISDYLLRGYERLNMSYETVACAREDKEILKLCKEGKSEEDIVQTVGDMKFYSQECVNAYFDSEVERFKRLETNADIKLSGFIEANRGKLLCRNLNEWHEPVVSYVVDEILKRLELPSLNIGTQDRERLLEDFCGSDIPVYPCVKEALGLTEDIEETKYRVVTYFGVRYMTWDEYVRYTVQYLRQAIDIMAFTGMDMTLEPVG